MRELIAPMSVFLSSGLPTRNVAMRSRNLRMTAGKIPSCTSKTRAGAADVALIEINAGDDAFDGLIDRRVFENDVGGFAAELEREFLFRSGDRLGEKLADIGRAGERDLVDVRDDRPAPGRFRRRR